ncbi:hypothetical protein H4Q26_010473 [Puccinia striiformis f. sp. tritici PST-130]|nr:hypothetical protein H4Q26_010473 [Puccinia striiformis f. sp. tritici PST-130]
MAVTTRNSCTQSNTGSPAKKNTRCFQLTSRVTHSLDRDDFRQPLIREVVLPRLGITIHPQISVGCGLYLLLSYPHPPREMISTTESDVFPQLVVIGQDKGLFLTTIKRLLLYFFFPESHDLFVTCNIHTSSSPFDAMTIHLSVWSNIH